MPPLIERTLSFLQELKRRQVFRVAVAYGVAAWVVIQVADTVFPRLHLPEWMVTAVILVALAGFPVALALAWAFDLSLDGLQPTPLPKKQGKATPAGASSKAPPRPARRAAERWKLWAFASVAGLAVAAGGWWYVQGSTPATNAGGKRTSVAVMYFENQTGEAQLDRVLTDMLTTNLARYDSLNVVSSQRLFSLLKRLGEADAERIPRDLAMEVAQMANAATIVSGSVVQLGEQIRVNAQLVDTQTGRVLASMQERGTSVEDVFAMTDRLTEKIGRELAGAAPDLSGVANVTTSSYEAYKRYQQGTDHLMRWRFDEAEQDFEAAIALDSTFAMAYRGLANARVQLIGVVDPFFDLRGARRAIDQALRHADHTTEQERLAIRMLHAMFYGRPAEAKQLAYELAARNPDDAPLLLEAAATVSFSNGPEATKPILQKILDTDPTFAPAYNQLAYVYAFAGDAEQAVSYVKRYRALFPDVYNAAHSMWEVYTLIGRHEEAYETAVKAVQAHPREKPWVRFHRYAGWSRILQGRPEEAHEHFRRFAEQAGNPPTAPLHHGYAYVYAGQYEEALRAFEQFLDRAQAAGSAQLRMYAHYFIGHLRHVQGRDEAARAAFAKAAAASDEAYRPDFNPGRLYSRFLTGMTYAEAGNDARTQDVIRDLERMIREQKLGELHRDYVRLLRAMLLVEKGRGAEAEAVLNEVTFSTEEFSPYYSRLLPAAYALQGKSEKAETLREQFANEVNRVGSYGQGDPFVFFYNRAQLDEQLDRVKQPAG